MIGYLVLAVVAIVYLAGLVLLVFAGTTVARNDARRSLFAAIGFSLIAASVLFHNVVTMLVSTTSVFGASLTVGSPTLLAWLVLLVSVGAAAALLYCKKSGRDPLDFRSRTGPE